MIAASELAPPAESVPALLDAEALRSEETDAESSARRVVATMLALRQEFGITRLGMVTRLDRIGVPVAQVARPASRSNAVSQGKGLTPMRAAASALMEELEVWAGERIPPARVRRATLGGCGPDIAALYAGLVEPEAPAGWRSLELAFVDGFDLMSGRVLPVPLALVDTDFVVPSAHPRVFPRTTTGLGAGATLTQAILHAGLECLERHALAQAGDRVFGRQIDMGSIGDAEVARLLRRLETAGMIVGAWRVPAPHGLPVFLCHVMEAQGREELAPLPAAGAACDFEPAAALLRALLEACQSRLTAISGAREDITRRLYPARPDRVELAGWRERLAHPPRWLVLPPAPPAPPRTGRLAALVQALRRAGAEAAMVVPLLVAPEAGLAAVRLVCPPLALNPRGAA